MLVRFGLASAVATFRIRVSRLLDDYLGTPGSPMPFGGRSRELGHLNAWLNNPSAPGAMLITAPAGRGKTALLVRWIDQRHPDIDVCFVPISIRYDTNRSGVFYQAMAHRLAEILGTELPQPATNLADYYKDKVLEFLDLFKNRSRPCLLVIDGLDEAAGWQVDSSVLPPVPPPGLRIVVSARQLVGHNGSADWKAQLGWDQPLAQALDFEVPLLDREGIADVLRSMGDPLAALSDTIDLVAELHRLTEGGDPLLLKLYVEDLTKPFGSDMRLGPENLPDLPSGFGAYFKRWFSEQRKSWQDAKVAVNESRLDAVLAVLACALGPLSLKDIGRLVDEVEPGGPILTLNTVAPLQRFIIGDGLESNLALSHPKLADYIKELYFGDSQIIGSSRTAYLRWGELTVKELDSGVLSPGDVSPYLLTYYIQHLEGVRPVPLERFRELANAGWRRAWQHFEGGDRGLSEQLEICFVTLLEACRNDRKLLRLPRIGVGGLLHIGLYLSSIRSSGTNCPVNFLFEMTRQGLISLRHVLFLSSFRSDYDRSELIVRLAPTLDQSVLAEVEREARQLRDRQHRVNTLLALARRMPTDKQRRLLTEIIISAGRAAARADEKLMPFSYTEEVIGSAVALAIESGQPFAVELRELASRIVASDRLPPLQVAPTAELVSTAPVLESSAQRSIYVSHFDPLIEAAASGASPGRFRDWAGKDVEEGEYADALRETLPSLDAVSRRILIEATARHRTNILLSVLMTTVDDNEFAFLLKQELSNETVSCDDLGEDENSLPALLERAMELAIEHPMPRPLLRMIGPRLSDYSLLRLLRALLLQENSAALRLIEGVTSTLAIEPRRAAIATIADSSNIWGDDMIAMLALAGDGELLNEVLEKIASGSGLFRARSWADIGLFTRLIPACTTAQVDTMMRWFIRLNIDDYKVSRMVDACIDRISPEIKNELLNWALRDDAGYYQRAIVLNLARDGPPELLQHILDQATNLPDVSARVTTIDSLLPVLSERDRAQAVRQVYRLALEIHDEPFQLVALAALGQQPTTSEEADAPPGWVTMLEQTSIAKYRAVSSCLLALLPKVNPSKSKEELLKGLQQVDSLSRDDRYAVYLLGAMTPHLNPLEARTVIHNALDAVSSTPDAESEAFANAMLLTSPYINQGERDRLIAKVEEQIAVMREKHEDARMGLMAIMAANPTVGAACARRMIDMFFAEFSTSMKESKDSSDRIFTAILMLSAHLEAKELAAAYDILEKLPMDDNARSLDYALLPYVDGKDLDRLGFRFLEDLRRSPRQEALAMLALVEGNWGDTIGLRPAVAAGGTARSFLERFGGPNATREAIDAITIVTQLWP